MAQKKIGASNANPNKSLWQERQGNLWTFICPHCRSLRKLPYRPRPGGLRQISQVALTAVFFTILTWPLFEWKGIVSFLPFWTLFEIVYRSRVRAVLQCEHCGFDALLFMTDEEKAKKEIELHWRRKFAEKGIPYPEQPKAGENNQPKEL